MSLDMTAINTAFSKLIHERGVHERLNLSSEQVRYMRQRLKNKSLSPISTDMKIKLLQKSGWRQDGRSYSQKDLVAAVKYALRKSKEAKEFGAEYIVEQFLKRK